MKWLKVNECPLADKIQAESCMEDDTIVQWCNTNGYRVKEGFGFVKIIQSEKSYSLSTWSQACDRSRLVYL